MDFQKAKIYLDKLNREFTRMSKDQENTIRIDVDIMASYIRELYDAILSESKIYELPNSFGISFNYYHAKKEFEDL